MKITKSQLKQIIKEEIDKVLNENQNEPFKVTHEVYGTEYSTEFQFNGFKTPYDQAFAYFTIKLDDGRIIKKGEMQAGMDTEDLAQNLAAKISEVEDSPYWFLDPGADDENYKEFVAKLEQNLEAKDIDPESQGPEARSYRDRDSGGWVEY